jgi:hypothetical protein
MPATAAFSRIEDNRFKINMTYKIAVLLAGWLCAAAAAAETVTIYVAPGGNDGDSGSQPSAHRNKSDGPVATLGRALERARAARKEQPMAQIRIVLRGGTYALEQPLVLTADDSGLTVAAYGHETPVITGEAPLQGWRRSPSNPDLWEAQAAGDWRFHELFVNGVRKGRARAPESGFYHTVSGPTTNAPNQFQFKPGDVKESWAGQGGVELVLFQAWAQSRNWFAGVDPASNVVTLAGEAYLNPFEKDTRYYIENARDALRPGQWQMDMKSGVVTYWPESGENAAAERITAPRLQELLRVEGKADRPAHDIQFVGLVFAGTDWPFTNGTERDIQAAVQSGGALQARFATHCEVLRCRFTRLGGYAIDFGHGCQNNKVVGCEMWDLGGGGVRLGDTGMGAALAAPNGGNVITDNHIHDIGVVHAPAVGVLVFLSANNVIAHNEIDHTYYTAISVGWTWGYGDTPCRGNIIEYNHLHDIGRGMLSDMGGVYTLGRQPGTIIRCNLIHDVNVFAYGGWGLYTDEGSSGIVLESNIVWRCQSAGFHQHYGETNLVYNNIFALNKEHQVMRTRAEKHCGFTFTNNIVYFDTGDLLGGRWSGTVYAFCHNVYYDARLGATLAPLDGKMSLESWREKGCDVDSMIADPLFVAAQRGDFRLKRGSPAVAFGFYPLDLRDAGPRKEYRWRR